MFNDSDIVHAPAISTSVGLSPAMMQADDVIRVAYANKQQKRIINGTLSLKTTLAGRIG
jgi:hypothetical protein